MTLTCSRRFQISLNLILRWRYACILALYHLCSSKQHHSRRCSRWRCSEWKCKHGRKHTAMQWNLQYKVDLKRLLKEQDHCCQWLVKWSAALVRLLSRNCQARWQISAWPVTFFISHRQNTRTFQLLYHGFLCTMVGQIPLGTQILQLWVLFHVFHDCVYAVLSHWSFLVPNAY